jgi:hypothetical protein
MPGFLLHVGAVTQCPHQGAGTTSPVQSRVLVSSQPVATAANQYLVAGCAFTVPGPKPQPCASIVWQSLATRVLVMGQPALVQASPGSGLGICQSAEQIPQGPPLVSSIQLRVQGV